MRPSRRAILGGLLSAVAVKLLPGAPVRPLLMSGSGPLLQSQVAAPAQGTLSKVGWIVVEIVSVAVFNVGVVRAAPHSKEKVSP